MKNSITNANSCSDARRNESLSAYRQTLADKAVSNKVSAVERIRARAALLASYIPDASVTEDEHTALRERITGLPDGLEGYGNRGIALMNAHRWLRELEDRIYIPLRRAAAVQFDLLCRDQPDMTGDTLLKTLVGVEIDDYRARNPAASENATLAALMRSSPRADIFISLIRQRNNEYRVTVFNWRPLSMPLQGL